MSLKTFVVAVMALFSLSFTGTAAADHTMPGPVAGTLPHWPGGPAEGLAMVSDRSGGRFPLAPAIAAWNASSVLQVVDVGPVCPGGGPHFCITIYADDRSANTGQAVTHVFGSHILAADIFISRHTDPSIAQALLTHEIGHGLGLGHRYDGTSVMRPWVYPHYVPDAHDMAQLATARRH